MAEEPWYSKIYRLMGGEVDAVEKKVPEPPKRKWAEGGAPGEKPAKVVTPTPRPATITGVEDPAIAAALKDHIARAYQLHLTGERSQIPPWSKRN